jgi:hypothetical protein
MGQSVKFLKYAANPFEQYYHTWLYECSDYELGSTSCKNSLDVWFGVFYYTWKLYEGHPDSQQVRD